MDSGQGQRAARALTEEINQAAEVAAGADLTEQQVPRGELNGLANGSMTDERAQALGRGAMMNGDAEMSLAAENDGGALVEAAAELSEDEDRELNPENFVGIDTEVQRREYAAEDAESLRNELGTGNPLDVRVTRKTEANVTKVVAEDVEKMLRKPRFEVSDLVKLRNDGSNKMLVDIFGRRVGDRN